MSRNKACVSIENTNVDGTIRLVSATELGDGGLSGWILVGGASTRMGRDKALIEIGGRPLALLAAEALAGVCESVSLVGDPDRYNALGLPVISDRQRGAGPLSGIEAALGASHSEWNLIAACDMPSLDASLLRELARAAADDAAIPQYPDGSIEPLCAVYHRRCHAAAIGALAEGLRRITDFIARLTVRYVQVTDPRPFLNLNTPEDLQNYHRG
jgi:molybdopterin-guanine dinucleotide biosynthesis protein A